jgi:hypothetical protein
MASLAYRLTRFSGLIGAGSAAALMGLFVLVDFPQSLKDDAAH